MRAIRQYLIVKNIKLETSKIAGLEIASDKDDDIRYYKGKVESAGEYAVKEGVSEGDIIWYDKHAGHDQVFNNILYRVISIGDVIIIE